MKSSCLVLAMTMLMVAAPARAVRKPHKLTKLDVGVYLASEFDAAVTYHALQNCGNRCYEANPMVRPLAGNAGVFVALGASAFAVNYLAHRLDNRGHHGWAKVLRFLAIGAHAGVGVQALALEH